MNIDSLQRHAEAISLIKNAKRDGIHVHTLIQHLGGSTQKSDMNGTKQDMYKFNAQLAKALDSNDQIGFDDELSVYYFNFPGQFLSSDEFDQFLLNRGVAIIQDYDISFEGIEQYIQEKVQLGELVSTTTSTSNVVRVYLNPFRDVDISEITRPDDDLLNFLWNEMSIPATDGEILQALRIKKLNISHLDCVTAPLTKQPKQRAVSVNKSSARNDASRMPSQLFGDLSKQAFSGDLLGGGSASDAQSSSLMNTGSQAQKSSTNTPITQVAPKGKSAPLLVYDKTSNPEEWELIRKTIYVFSQWLPQHEYSSVLLNIFLEIREIKQKELFRALGYLNSSRAADKEDFTSLGFPDISAFVNADKSDLMNQKLGYFNNLKILASRNISDQNFNLIWSMELIPIFNMIVYRLEYIEARIREKMAASLYALRCPVCQKAYVTSDTLTLAKKGSTYYCVSPCNAVLDSVNEVEAHAKYEILLKKVSQLEPLKQLFAMLRDRGSNLNFGNGHTKVTTTGNHSSSGGAKKTPSIFAKRTPGSRGTGSGSERRLLGTNSQNKSNGTNNKTDSFQMSLSNAPEWLADHISRYRETISMINTTRIEDSFDVHPLTFGNSADEDYRVYLPVIDDAVKASKEIGVTTAKLLLDNVADFVHMIRNPVTCRYFYCYQFTLRSLFIAHKRGFRPTEILRILRLLSSSVPPCIRHRIMNQEAYVNYYKAVMILVNCRYFLRATDIDILRQILNKPELVKFLPSPQILKSEDSATKEVYYWLEVDKDHRSTVKIHAFEMGIPIIDEYSFAQMSPNAMAGGSTSLLPNSSSTSSSVYSNSVAGFAASVTPPDGVIRMKHVPVVLLQDTRVRDYQSMSCSKLYWDNFKAHSGILVLPCGAGKTLIGVTCFATMQTPCIIFCQSTLAVSQWAEQISQWTNLAPVAISKFTSHHHKNWNKDAEVIISTYSMFSSDQVGRHRSSDSQKMVEHVRKREWGLMILDEVHQAPAEIFRIVTGRFYCHVKVGLTATLVREDTKVAMLPSLVGPTLYELDVSTLKKRNYIAPIECHEIRLPFTEVWRAHYKKDPSVPHNFWNIPHSLQATVKRLLFITNPNKILACMTLIDRHLKLDHKIVIFCDDLIGLECYENIFRSFAQFADKHPFPLIRGDTTESDRDLIVKNFKAAPRGDWLLFSKVGDMSIDLPEARVLIQIAATQGSRMQEGQRIGRIQRKFDGKPDQPHTRKTLAYAYSLVSGESQSELGFSARRRNYLEEHGYPVIMHEMTETAEFLTSGSLEKATQEKLMEFLRDRLTDRVTGKSKETKKLNREKL